MLTWYEPTALFFRLKEKAFKECDPLARAYADCCRGRIVSVAWACRQEAKLLSACMTQYTSRLEKLKERWVASGSRLHMSDTDWEGLLEGLI